MGFSSNGKQSINNNRALRRQSSFMARFKDRLVKNKLPAHSSRAYTPEQQEQRRKELVKEAEFQRKAQLIGVVVLIICGAIVLWILGVFN